MKHQQGFTLIELIVVIVILGILAATALPRFANLRADALVANLNGARGSMSSASSIARGAFLINPVAAATIEGVAVVYVNGYPDAASIDDLAQITAADYTIIPPSTAASGTAPGTAAGQVAVVPNAVAGTATAVTCFITFTQSAALNTPPIISAAPTTANCT